MKTTTQRIVTGIIVVCAAGVAILVFRAAFSPCRVQKEAQIAQGSSMQGIISGGEVVTVYKNYYACKDVGRGDIVAYTYNGSVTPFIRVVKAVPGDRWSLRAASGRYQIIVNGEPLKNSFDQIYLIDERAKNVLFSSVNEASILKDTYLILGNLPFGSVDSTQFGLVLKKDITGKVIVSAGSL